MISMISAGILIVDCFASEVVSQKEVVFTSDNILYSSGDISFCSLYLCRIFNVHEINLFMSTIAEIQEECEKKTLLSRKTTHVLLPDKDSALLLQYCLPFFHYG